MFDLDKEINDRINALDRKSGLIPGVTLHISVNDPVATMHGAPYEYEVMLDATNTYPTNVIVHRFVSGLKR